MQPVLRFKDSWDETQRMGLVALLVLALDQLTKFVVMRFLGFSEEHVVIEGFFRLVHWGNTGAAWSVLKGNNNLLALVSALALILLYAKRRYFAVDKILGQIALGLLFGGIMGNLTDRLLQSRRHVVDFLYFYVNRRGGGEIGFPAFNIADSAICIGVFLLFLLTCQKDRAGAPAKTVRPAGEMVKETSD